MCDYVSAIGVCVHTHDVLATYGLCEYERKWIMIAIHFEPAQSEMMYCTEYAFSSSFIVRTFVVDECAGVPFRFEACMQTWNFVWTNAKTQITS